MNRDRRCALGFQFGPSGIVEVEEFVTYTAHHQGGHQDILVSLLGSSHYCPFLYTVILLRNVKSSLFALYVFAFLTCRGAPTAGYDL